MSRVVFIDSASNFHPWECNGPGHCIHCDRTEDEQHDPKVCALCDDDDLRAIADLDIAIHDGFEDE